MTKDDRPRPTPSGMRRIPAREEIRVFTPREIFEHLDRYVVGPDRAKRAVAIAAHNHLKRIEQRRSARRRSSRSRTCC